jgi:uncharacterized membrane protein
MVDQPRCDKAGFRLRGLHMSGIEAFTDAAFAFALSLLVISLSPPTSLDKLYVALGGIPSFLASASILMMFWWGHHEWSRRYGLDDGKTLILSCALVFTVLIYVYPLRFVFSLMFESLGRMAGLPLESDATIQSLRDVNQLFIVYGAGFAAMSCALVLLHAHAWSKRDVLELDEIERHETKANLGAWLILLTAGLLSAVVAVVVPDRWVGAPGWIYAPLAIVMPLYGYRMDRNRPARLPQRDLEAREEVACP